MNESTHRHSILVGIFVLLGVAILVAGVLLIGNLSRSFQNKIKIVTYVDDVNGLQKGNFIWFSGVRIGSVKSLSILRSSSVEVVMDIESKIMQNIHKDSKVKLGSDGLIGNRILIIYGGTPNISTIEDGDTIMFERGLAADDLLSTLQQSNENLKAITSDFKIISRKLVDGEGTVGKLLSDNSLYTNISSAVSSLQGASTKAAQLMNSLADFSSGLQKEGTLAHELTSDTVVFNSIRASFLKIGHMADTASLLINNLKEAADDPKSSIGLLLHDEDTGAELKRTITNLEKSTEKLNIDLEALQHSFLLKGYFKHQADSAK